MLFKTQSRTSNIQHTTSNIQVESNGKQARRPFRPPRLHDRRRRLQPPPPPHRLPALSLPKAHHHGPHQSQHPSLGRNNLPLSQARFHPPHHPRHRLAPHIPRQAHRQIQTPQNPPRRTLQNT